MSVCVWGGSPRTGSGCEWKGHLDRSFLMATPGTHRPTSTQNRAAARSRHQRLAAAPAHSQGGADRVTGGHKSPLCG